MGLLGVLGWWFTSLLVQHHHRVDSGLFTLETRSQTGRNPQSSGGAFQNKSLGALKQRRLTDLINASTRGKTDGFICGNVSGELD